jgi:splicing factor 3B subunit 1
MIEAQLKKDEREVREAILKKASKGDLPATEAAKPERKRKRWDQHTPSHDEEGGGAKKKSAWDQAESTPTVSHWEGTPGHLKGSETPGASATPSTRIKWDATPGHATPGHATPATPGKRNRWDLTPKWNETPRADSGMIFASNILTYASLIIFALTLSPPAQEGRPVTLGGLRPPTRNR